MRASIISVIISVFVFAFGSATATNKLDSLLTEYKKVDGENEQLELCIELSKEYKFTDIDSSRYFALKCIDISTQLNKEVKVGVGYNLLGVTYYFQGERDSALKYFNMAAAVFRAVDNDHELAKILCNTGLLYDAMGNDSLALKCLDESMVLYSSFNDSLAVGDIFINLGTFYYMRSAFDSSFFYFNKALSIFGKIPGSIEYQADASANIGNLFLDLGEYGKALENYIFAERVYDSVNNPFKRNLVIDLISNLYEVQDMFDKALIYRYKVMAFYKSQGNPGNLNNVYMNMGNIHDRLGNVDSSLYYYSIAAAYFISTGDSLRYANTMHNTGVMLLLNDKPDAGIKYLEKGLAIRVRLQDDYGLATSNHWMGEYYYGKEDYKKSARHFERSLLQIKKLGLTGLRSDTEYKYGIVLLELGRYKEAIPLIKSAIDLRDSIYNQDKQRVMLEMNARFQTGKMEQEIEKQRFMIERNREVIAREQAEKEKKAAYLNLFIVAFVLVLVVAVIAIRSFRNKKKANLLLQEKNDEIMQAKEEIEAQRDILSEQKEHIVEINNELTDSINYAKRIQSAILPDKKLVEQHFSDFFILFKPKDIVSGDFYWMTEVDNKVVTVVADCTGHGVPGAFMSMLGSAFMNEIVNKEYISHSGVILKRLRKEIIRSLKQQESSDDQGSTNLSAVRDGMDLSLVVYDKKEKKIQFSGANNPLYLLLENSRAEKKIADLKAMEQEVKLVKSGTHTLIEIKGDKMPIAIYERMEPFRSVEIDVESGDILYLFSDGFADQFGGPKGKKLKYSVFKTTLLELADGKMEDQLPKLEKILSDWMNYTDPLTGHKFAQVDDITLMGLKI